MKKFLASISLAILFLATMVTPAFADTTQDVTVTLTPSFVALSNSPNSYDFSTTLAGVDEETSNGYYTANTSGSSVNTDINIQSVGGWSGSPAWTWGAPGENQGQMKASSADGGTGGSSGAGNFDITVLNGSDTLLCDNVTAGASVTWELQADVASSFTHGAEQTTTIRLTIVAE